MCAHVLTFVVYTVYPFHLFVLARGCLCAVYLIKPEGWRHVSAIDVDDMRAPDADGRPGGGAHGGTGSCTCNTALFPAATAAATADMGLS